MTEKQYLIASDLTKLRMAKEVLRDVIPELTGIIKQTEYAQTMRTLNHWIELHNEKIKFK